MYPFSVLKQILGCQEDNKLIYALSNSFLPWYTEVLLTVLIVLDAGGLCELDLGMDGVCPVPAAVPFAAALGGAALAGMQLPFAPWDGR